MISSRQLRALPRPVVALAVALMASTPTGAIAGPDLATTAITLDPPGAAAGDGEIVAEVANIGDESTGFFVQPNWIMTRDGVQCDEGFFVAGFGAGETSSRSVSKCVPDAPGTYQIAFFVDSKDDVPD